MRNLKLMWLALANFDWKRMGLSVLITAMAALTVFSAAGYFSLIFPNTEIRELVYHILFAVGVPMAVYGFFSMLIEEGKHYEE